MNRFQMAEVLSHCADWLFGDIKRIKDEYIELDSGLIDLLIERRESPLMAVKVNSGVASPLVVDEAQRCGIELQKRIGKPIAPCVVANSVPAAVRRRAIAHGVEIFSISVQQLEALAVDTGLRQPRAA